MKKNILFIAFVLFSFTSAVKAQTVIWSDDFESYANAASAGTAGFDVWEGSGAVSDVTIAGGTAHSGNKYLVGTRSTTLNKSLYFRKKVTVTLVEGSSYILEAWIKSPDLLAVKTGINLGTANDVTSTESTNSTSWTKVSQSFTVGAGQTVAMPLIYMYSYAVSTKVHVDDMRILLAYNIAASGTNGTITGGTGITASGTSTTLTATPNTGYHFVNWTEGGSEVSTYPSYTFTVSGARTLVANFEADIPIPSGITGIIWTGAAGDGDFFNEVNWKVIATNTAPIAGTINPGVAVNSNLNILNARSVVGGISGISSDVLMGTGNLLIRKSTLKMAAGKGIDMGNALNTLTIDSAVVNTDFLKNATTTITGDAKLYLSAADPFDAATNINITSNDAWIFATNLNAATALTSHVPRIKLNGSALLDLTNARISQYYYGCAIAAYSSTLAPLRVFDDANLNGIYADITVQTIKSGAGIPSNLNNRVVSFKLKKGYMVTFAVGEDGTGMSKVYIASETDLIINALPSALSDKISFIRVVPWVWVNKKGFGIQYQDATYNNAINTNGLWFYNWGANLNSTINFDYAPMNWGKTGLDTPAERTAVINKARVTHTLSFNEADDCAGQSGQWGSLCVPDTAALWHKHAMKLGLRIVSPASREKEELDWLKLVNNIMIPAGTRMDVIGMHWYDWGGYSAGSASDATSIFNRFKSQVTACYNYYKMPIWITEFNANLYRTQAVEDAFLQLALPWLEATPYVERYAYYQPANAKLRDASGNLTSTGNIYFNQVSTPSIPESYVNSYINNLESRINEVSIEPNTIVVSSGIMNASDITCTDCDVTVGSGAELNINATKTLKSITVAAGGKLTLNAALALTATNGVTLQNTATGTASFVDSRTENSPTAITGTVEQTITETNRNWYLAIPVSGKAVADITLTGASVVKRNETGAGSWDLVSGTLIPGVGYVALASTSAGTANWSLTGNLNSGKVEVAVTRSGSTATGFNLLGNPYPSYLNWEQVLNLNATNASILQSSIWYRTASFNAGLNKFDYTFNTYNSTGRIATPTSTTGYIPPMQAFWVRANNAGTVTLTNAMRSHGNGATNLLKVSKINTQKIIRLQVTNTNSIDETVVYFDENAQNSFDNYDTQKMFNNIALKPEIFTKAGNEQLVINGLREIQYETEIPVGFITGQASDFRISVTEITNFESGTRFFLKDKLNPASEFELSDGISYNFSSQPTTASDDRFSMILRAPGTTGLKETEKHNAQVFVNAANQMTIISPEKSNYAIYNAVGQKLNEGVTTSNIQTLNLKLQTGVYVVKLANRNSTRVIIK